jgi:MFS family permease
MPTILQKLATGPLAALHYTAFRTLWLASLISITTFFMVIIARGWLVLQMTDSTFLVVAIQAVSMIPMMFFSPIGGVIADAFERKYILILGELLNVAALLVLAILLVMDQIVLWHVFALSLVSGLAFSLMMPARSAMVPNVIPFAQLPSGMALFSTIFSAGQLIGPAIAGILLNLFDLWISFLAPSLILFFSILIMCFLPTQTSSAHQSSFSVSTLYMSFKEGVRYTVKSPFLVGLMLLGLGCTIFAMPYQSLLPIFAEKVLQIGPGGLGFLGASAGIGAVLGSFLIAAINAPENIRRFMNWSGIVLGVWVVLFGISSIFWVSVILSAFLGLALQMFLTSNFILVQIVIPDEVRGRVIGFRMIIMGLGPIGILLLGILAEQLGPQTGLALMGLACLAFTIAVLLFMPVLRSVPTTE